MTPRTDREIWWVGFKPDERLEAVWADFARDLEKENAELREAKDAFFKHNNILVNLMTEEQKKKALDILVKSKEAQP